MYSTRHADDYHISFSITNLFKNSIRHSGPVLWNTIEYNVQMLPNVHIFKRAYKGYVLTENYRQGMIIYCSILSSKI